MLGTFVEFGASRSIALFFPRTFPPSLSTKSFPCPNQHTGKGWGDGLRHGSLQSQPMSAWCQGADFGSANSDVGFTPQSGISEIEQHARFVIRIVTGAPAMASR